MVAEGSLKALKILSKAAAVISKGEVMQLPPKSTASTRRALTIIPSKTAALFAAACELGAAMRRAPRRAAALRSYGLNLGIAFQLVDDALDYADTSQLGKTVGDDFREGKITLPVILCFRRGSARASAHSGTARSAKASPSRTAISSRPSALMKKHNAIEATLERARHYGAIARDALALFPASPMKQALEETVEFCICRSN